MSRRTNLDMDVLRTFAAGFELGSFARAAERLGRSQSAVSTQLRKLEDQVGQSLVQRSGRKLVLTTAGERLLTYAKRLLALNDEAVEHVRGAEAGGWVRLGLPQDFAEAWLPEVLDQIARAYPQVSVDVQICRSFTLVEMIAKGELDLAIAWGSGHDAPHAEWVADFPVQWIARANWNDKASLERKPLPLVCFTAPCSFRSVAEAALEKAEFSWRFVVMSPSLTGIWAAAESGLGITARATVNMPKTLCALDPLLTGLPVLPSVPLTLYRAEAKPTLAVRRLIEIVLTSLRSTAGTGALAA